MYIVQVVAGVCASSKYQYMMYKYHLGFLTYLVSAISPSKCHRLREQPKPGIYGQRPLLRPLSISTLHFISCQSSFRGQLYSAAIEIRRNFLQKYFIFLKQRFSSVHFQSSWLINYKNLSAEECGGRIPDHSNN